MKYIIVIIIFLFPFQINADDIYATCKNEEHNISMSLKIKDSQKQEIFINLENKRRDIFSFSTVSEWTDEYIRLFRDENCENYQNLMILTNSLGWGNDFSNDWFNNGKRGQCSTEIKIDRIGGRLDFIEKYELEKNYGVLTREYIFQCALSRERKL